MTSNEPSASDDGLEKNSESSSKFSALNLTSTPLCIMNPDRAYEYSNDAWQDCVPGASPVFASDDWMERVHPVDRETLMERWEQAVASTSAFGMDIRLVDPAGRERWFMLLAQPQTHDRGKICFCLSLSDIHELKVRNFELEETSKIQAEMLDVSVDCVKLINPDGTILHMNKEGCLTLNVAEDSGFGMDWVSLLPQEVHVLGRSALEEAIAGRNARFPGISRLSDADVRYWDNVLTPLKNAQGNVSRVLCVSRDVTIQRENEHRIELLMHELDHRSRNLLSVVQALIWRSVPDRTADYVRTIEQGIETIARNYENLVEKTWHISNVPEIINSQTVIAANDGQSRLSLRGDPELLLCPKAAEVISLAMHELMTNATKYGALSTDHGTIAIHWDIRTVAAEDWFHLRWEEVGGPEVREPSRQGFGTVITEHNPQAALNGKVTRRYDPLGTVWTFEAPAANIIAT